MEYISNGDDGNQDVIYDENSQLQHLSQLFEPKLLEYILYAKEEALNGGNSKEFYNDSYV